MVLDEPDVRDIAVKWLSELGYDVLTAADGRTALEMLKREDRVDVDAAHNDGGRPHI